MTTCSLGTTACTLLTGLYALSGNSLSWTDANSCNWPGVSCTAGSLSGIVLDSQSLTGTVPNATWNALAALLPSFTVFSVNHNNNLAGTMPSNVIYACMFTANGGNVLWMRETNTICRFWYTSVVTPFKFVMDTWFGAFIGDIFYNNGNIGVNGDPTQGPINGGGWFGTVFDFSGSWQPWSLPTDPNWYAGRSMVSFRSFLSTFGGSIPAINYSAATSLTWLDIEGASLVGTIPFTSLATMPALNNLIIADTTLVGTIPDTVCLLTSLTNLDLSYNANLTGTIPSCLGTLMQNGPLRGLNFMHSGFTGTIPPLITTLCAYAFMGFQCSFGSTSLTLGATSAGSGSGGAAFDPTLLQASIASLNATFTAALAALTASQRALQVNISNAAAACAAAG